ncbi:biotin transporter BioY [Oceanobacillus massiliensis]|uniref:biotin transporter BioY n=1 Tax=Oceanobacillus massiliensis TaxID=1465765 RepID=UPI0002889247|nr:biotin transporter BioY [Oceanobacillus massiliensis]
MKKLRPIDLTYGALFVCLMVIGANIAVWFPFLTIPIGGATVPVSLQTFFAVLAGMLLGKRLGAIAMIVYMLIGAAGVPVFAGMKGGFFALISPTGGFIISFIFVAYVVGWLTESRPALSIAYYTWTTMIGLFVNYLIGVSYMYLAMNTWLGLDVTYMIAWAGMVPFILKDAVLSVCAAFFMVKLVKRIPATLKNTGV